MSSLTREGRRENCALVRYSVLETFQKTWTLWNETSKRKKERFSQFDYSYFQILPDLQDAVFFSFVSSHTSSFVFCLSLGNIPVRDKNPIEDSVFEFENLSVRARNCFSLKTCALKLATLDSWEFRKIEMIQNNIKERMNEKRIYFYLHWWMSISTFQVWIYLVIWINWNNGKEIGKVF